MKVFAHFSKISRYFTCFVASRTTLSHAEQPFCLRSNILIIKNSTFRKQLSALAEADG